MVAAVATSIATIASAPNPSTVQSRYTPGAGSTTRTGPNSVCGERPIAIATASSAPTRTAPLTPSNPSVDVVIGPAPSARDDLDLVSVLAQRTRDGLAGEEQRREQRHEPEHAERGGLGPDRALRVGFDGRRHVHEELTVDIRDLARGGEVRVLVLDGGGITPRRQLRARRNRRSHNSRRARAPAQASR